MNPLEKIFKICCDYYGVTEKAAKAKIRNPNLVAARHLYCWYSYPYFSLAEIGKLINCDHSTVSYARKKISDTMDFNKILMKAINETIDEVKKTLQCTPAIDSDVSIDNVIFILQSVNLYFVDRKKINTIKKIINKI
jgi:hypothetical protein